jgi:hypothetical protein
MTDNLRIWNAVSKTDPNHTKPVEFGRRFTSIDAHWQIMQATKQFGPVGEGWGYNVHHGVERLTDTMILAVADVTIWWRHFESHGVAAIDRRQEYGPIRATCEMYGPKTYKGKAIPGEFVCDEDAPKKAMTDALTKGLSHLGFSADVFLGLFDDNRYVQRVAKEFANGNSEPPPAAPSQRVGQSAEPRGLQHVHPDDRHLIQGDGRSVYQIKTGDKGPGRLNAELWASAAVTLFKQDGFSLLHYADWKKEPCTPKGRVTNEAKLEEIREKHPDLGQKVDDAIANIPSVAA